MPEDNFEIVVQVLNVVGYEFCDEDILLRFTLEGHRLETERIHAISDKVQVNTSLTWNTTRGDVKRMKAENLPIRVECLRFRDNHAESIGYILIPLRIIPTLLYQNDPLSSPRWYKFMGVPNNIICNRPELHLNVIIQAENGECLPSPCRQKLDQDPVAFQPIPMEMPDPSEKYLKQLEEWKSGEMENFLKHLQKVENTFLETMYAEWQRKKEEQENKLKWTIEECEKLSQKLADGYGRIKDVDRNEQEVASAVSQNIQDELERMDLALRNECEKNKMLNAKISELINEKQQMETSLESLKSSKDYYKHKWVALIREVNKLDPCEQ